MQRLTHGQLLYSPSDLITFLACRHASFLDVQNLAGQLEKKESTEIQKLLRQRGIAHEQSYLQHLKDQHCEVQEIPANRSLEARAELTVEAMHAGADVIYQAVFVHEPWCGYADFLIRCDTPSLLGDYSYEVLDTKLAQSARPKHLVQLCMYSMLLATVQDLRPANMHLFSGAGEKLRFRVSDFYSYCTHARQCFEKYMDNLPKISYPETCTHCNICAWQELCSARWEADDHLCRIANIRRTQIDKLHRGGIQTVTQLAAAPEDAGIPGLDRQAYDRLRSQATLQSEHSATGKRRFEIVACPADRGFARLPMPDEGDLFFDLEGDPLYPNGLEYLFGVHCMTDGKEDYQATWAHDHRQEKQIFRDFMHFLEDHLKAHPNAHIYHYNHYEITALKRLASRYTSCEETLDALLRTQMFVDLYQVVRECIRTSEPGYSIKNLEAFYMDQRENSVSSALDSMITYSQWQETGDDSLLHEIAEYNRSDCISTRLLRNWLLDLRPSDLPWPDTLADRNPEHFAQGNSNADHPDLQDRLKMIRNESSALGMYLPNLLEFHKREAKPRWWSRFDRQNKFDDELIDDTECLALLQKSGPTEFEGPYCNYTFRFPPQEYKLKVGHSVTNARTLEFAGTIVDLDEARRVVKIRNRADRGTLPTSFSAGPDKPIDNRSIRSAIYRYAEHVMCNPGQTHVVTELLERRIPRIQGKAAGEPILTSQCSPADILQTVTRLDHSYLFIQGPPGSGKTYASAHIITELLRRGKKIGITSSSHKAIHNLLEQVVNVASREQVRFFGVKKATRGSSESSFAGPSITNETRTENINLRANLFAGTAWLFSHAHLQGQLDYLFIDEAGQVALANVVAMAMSTDNIILVGDQMQLAQPVQGVHPDESGLSVLEFLLGDRPIIPPEHGIFMDRTYRLKPGICRFVSEAFYDGQLAPHESTLQRSLELCKTDLPDEGIVMIAARHEYCSQKSIEEGKILEARYMELLGQTLRDGNGNVRPIDKEDILVVTPYNVQVNYLRTLLPKGARIGTVDKFQGQEAPIVLISMVTSSAADLPRNIEFLYSRNRLNVAISRAQCLAIIIASPRLLEIPCKTIEQMKLANIFCQLNEYATQASPTVTHKQVCYAPRTSLPACRT